MIEVCSPSRCNADAKQFQTKTNALRGHVHEALGGPLLHAPTGDDGFRDEVRLVLSHLCRHPADANGLRYAVRRFL